MSKAARSDSPQFIPGTGHRFTSLLSLQSGLDKGSRRYRKRATKNHVQVQAGNQRASAIHSHAANETEVEEESNASADKFTTLGRSRGGKVLQDMKEHVRRDVREGSVTDDEDLGEFKYTDGRRILKCMASQATWTISPYATAEQAVQARRILEQKLSQRKTPSRKQGAGSGNALREGLRPRGIGKSTLPPVQRAIGDYRKAVVPSEQDAECVRQGKPG